jgi:hypothetical protein
MDTAMQTKWLSSEQVAQRWNIDLLKIFEYFKEGLQAYTEYGWKIHDARSCKRKRRFSIEELKAKYPLDPLILETCTCPETPCIEIQKWEAFIIDLYTSQPLDVIVPPEPRSYPMRLASPSNYEEVETAIDRLKICRFKPEDILHAVTICAFLKVWKRGVSNERNSFLCFV